MKMKGCLLAGLSAAAAVAALLLPGLGASAQDAKKTPLAKAVSSCKGLDAKACKGKATECLWVVPKKGKQRPYCRLKTARKKK